MDKNENSEDDAVWNICKLPPPDPFVASTNLTSTLKFKVLKLREKMFNISKTLSELKCLHVEAAALSRFLYRNYRSLRKDKGFQLLKTVMTALNKYLRMDVLANVELIRRNIPLTSHFSEAVVLPTQAAIGWILSRIQALAALFYRVFHLTKKAGKFLYMRLRLFWNPTVLILCLGLTARIHVIARHVVLEAVAWHSSITPLLRAFAKVDNNPFINTPRDLKTWLGGLEDLSLKSASGSTLDMVFQLIDLTNDDQEDENHRGFVKVIKDLEAQTEDEEVERLYELIALPSSHDTSSVHTLDEDDVEILSIQSEQQRAESEDIGEPVSMKTVEVISDDEVVVLSDSHGDKKKKRLKNRKRRTGDLTVEAQRKVTGEGLGKRHCDDFSSNPQMCVRWHKSPSENRKKKKQNKIVEGDNDERRFPLKISGTPQPGLSVFKNSKKSRRVNRGLEMKKSKRKQKKHN